MSGERYTVRASEAVPGLSVQFHNHRPVLIIRPDGRIELGEGCTNADAAQVLVDLANKVCAERSNHCGGHQTVAIAPSAWLLMDGRGEIVGSTTSRQEADGWCSAPWRTIEPLHRIRRGP